MHALLVSLAPIVASPAAFDPHGPWQVAYEESMCLAARRFGARGEVTVAFRPGPLNEYLEVSVDMRRWPGRLRFRGKADLQIERGDQRFEGQYEAMGDAGTAIRAVVVFTRNEMLDRLSEGDVLTFAPQPNGRVAVRMTNMTKLKAALADCRLSLLKHWGVDLHALAAVSAPAKPVTDPASWITTNDYPTEALRLGTRGTSNILWKITEHGEVSECRIVASSGADNLDRAACDAITRRGRFQPAYSANGKPVASWMNRRVRWRAFRP